jgi:23S rRNA pseudouridine1911/1915/1917 synthase
VVGATGGICYGLSQIHRSRMMPDNTPEVGGYHLPPELLPRCLAEQSGVAAVWKPPGLATQAPPGCPSVEAWFREGLRRRSGQEADPYLGIPHRLDRAVSGVLLLATTPRAARQLSRQFERRQVAKRYLAVVTVDAASSPSLRESAACRWQDWLAKIPDQPRARIVTGDRDAATIGREAITHVRPLGPLLRPTAQAAVDWLLLLEPLTGRMHQLRLQSAVRGAPIRGDRLYGGPPLEASFVEGSAAEQQAMPILLHAWQIIYRDPETGGVVTITAPLPSYWPREARALIEEMQDGELGQGGAIQPP